MICNKVLNRPILESCSDYFRLQAALSEPMLDYYEQKLDEYCKMTEESELYLQNLPRIVCWFEGLISTDDLINELAIIDHLKNKLPKNG